MKRPAAACPIAAIMMGLIGGWAIACANQESPAPPSQSLPDGAVELLDELEHARLRREQGSAGLLNAGDDGAFDAGWRLSRKVGDCAPCALGVGSRSGLELFVSRPRDLTLHLRCGAHQLGPDQRRTAEVRIGGELLGKLLLHGDRRDFDVDVPASALARGINLVTFTYRGDLAEARRKGGAPPELGAQMACSAIGLPGVPDVPTPRKVPEGGLELAAGSAVDFWLDTVGGERLLVRGERRGSARLICQIAPVRGEPREVELTAKIAEGGSAVEREVGLAGGGIKRVSLHAVGEDGSVRVDSVGLAGAVKRSPEARFEPPRVSRRPHIAIFLVDTLRRDRLGAYGYDRPTSPNLDSFAKEGVLFERAVAVAPWTKPAVASIFTGLEPPIHGVSRMRSVLPASAETLAELLAAAGYQTVAFAGTEVITTDAGFAQGFEEFFEFEGERGCAGPDSPVVLADLERWLGQRTDDRPLFLYVHTVDPHAPYAPAAEHRERLAPSARARLNVEDLLAETRDEASALYDGEVAFADAGFGRFLELLRGAGIYDDGLVGFVADHGEQFLEHGGWRHRDLFREVIDVPLVIKPPAGIGSRDRRVKQRVTQTDLLPTIAELVGLPISNRVTGRSLLPAIVGDPEGLADRMLHGHVRRGRKTAWSIIAPPFKLIWRQESTHQQRLLYEIEQDPKERRDLAARLPVQREYLEQLIRRARAGHAPLERRRGKQLSDEQAARLEALGYLN